MTIEYRGPSSTNRWLFVDDEVSPETLYCLDYNPNGEPIAPRLRALLPAEIVSEITRQSLRRRP